MELSVIIPVYNVKQTLSRCVQSVLSQNVENMEVVLVDDGSVDGSGAMCDEWAACDARIRVVHQKNKGLSAARNSGLRRAGGQWITFVDSDDYLSANTYAPMIEFLRRMNDCDLLEFSVVRNEDEQWLELPCATYHSWQDYFMSARTWEHAYAWNKIYKRSLMEGLAFPEGKNFEDILFLPSYLQRCKTICTTAKGAYHYTVNPAGITINASAADYGNLLEGYERLLHLGLPRKHPNFKHLYAQMLNVQITVYELSGSAPIIPVLPYYHTPKLLLLHLLGMKGLCKAIVKLKN